MSHWYHKQYSLDLAKSCFCLIYSNFPNTILSISPPTIRIMTFFICFSAPRKRCIIILVSIVSVKAIFKMMFCFVICTSLFSNWYSETVFVRKSSNLIFLRRKSLQLLVIAFWRHTFLLIPPPRFSLVVFFRLLSKYWSQTMSTRFTLFHSAQIYRIKMFSAYCGNVEKGAGFSKLTNSPLSII